jgi:hypothetical protein
MDGIFLVPFAPFLFVLGIIFLNNKRKLEEKRIESARFVQEDPGAARRDERVEALEDRVRVLERIVTDGGYDLATKIEALRDERPIKQRLETPDRQETI